jgi:hypothetical protein
MLECHDLREQLQSARHELAASLYQHDAACRVIARLQRERQAAQAALEDLRGQLVAAEAAAAAAPREAAVEVGTKRMRTEVCSSVAAVPGQLALRGRPLYCHPPSRNFEFFVLFGAQADNENNSIHEIDSTCSAASLALSCTGNAGTNACVMHRSG